MMHTLDFQETVSNTGAKYEDKVPADVAIRITRPHPDDGQFDFALFGDIKSADRYESGISKHSRTEIFTLVESCRKLWKELVVDYQLKFVRDGKTQFGFPFQEGWDFKAKPDYLNRIAPQLAKAGEDLFTSVFERNCDEGLKKIARILRDKLSSKQQRLAITSSKFFVPWGMLYTHPVSDPPLAVDGSNWKPEGFWGLRHIVQQTPEKQDLENGIRPDTSGKVTLSINFDERLKETMGRAIEEHINWICTLGAVPIKRTKKTELELGFKEARDSLESILYFYCHGSGSSTGTEVNLSEPHLIMTDGVVSAHDFERWSNGNKLPTSPLIFINACQGGQMTTMFYETFSVELLKEGAVGLIGAQIDVPAIFGAEYARRVFTEFFTRKDSETVRLGPLISEINWKFWKDHNNPLGLVYSLYRGVDCFIVWPDRVAQG